jgi:hypothetical protein
MLVTVLGGGILPSTTLAAAIDSGPDISGPIGRPRINATPVTRLERDSLPIARGRPRAANAFTAEGIGEMKPVLSYCVTFV